MLNDFYRCKEWVLFRLGVMDERQTEDGRILCEHCGLPIVHQYDCIAHHKIPLTEQNYKDATISLNPDNIALVHHVCHNKMHNKLGKREREVWLVYGPPLSGKSSYVDSVKEFGDLIVDVDCIWECLSGCEKYVKPSRITDNVFGVRNILLEQVQYKLGNWCSAYIIGGFPLIGERERLCRRLGAKEIYIESTREKCLARLKDGCAGRNPTEWKKYIDEWWDKYTPHHS